MGSASCTCAVDAEEVLSIKNSDVVANNELDVAEKAASPEKLQADLQTEALPSAAEPANALKEGFVPKTDGTGHAQHGFHSTVQVLAASGLLDPEADHRDEVEAELLRVKKAVEAEEASFSTDPWRDVSKPSVKIWFKTKTKPARDCVWLSVQTEDQVPAVPLLETKDGRIVCGAIPTTLAIPHWPLWFPFCDSNVLLKRFSVSRFMVHCKLKVLFFHFDFVLLINIEDKLNLKEDCLEVSILSPPPGTEGGEWLGVDIPPKSGSFPRICIRHGFMRLRPTSRQHVNFNYQTEMDDVSGAPQWLKVFAIQQIGIRIVPELVRFQAKIPGSPMDDYLNGKGENCMDEESLTYLHELSRSLVAYTERGEAARKQS